MFEVLECDVHEWMGQLKGSDSQFARRSFSRALFSYIEGVLFTMKRVVPEYINPVTGTSQWGRAPCYSNGLSI